MPAHGDRLGQAHSVLRCARGRRLRRLGGGFGDDPSGPAQARLDRDAAAAARADGDLGEAHRRRARPRTTPAPPSICDDRRPRAPGCAPRQPSRPRRGRRSSVVVEHDAHAHLGPQRGRRSSKRDAHLDGRLLRSAVGQMRSTRPVAVVGTRVEEDVDGRADVDGAERGLGHVGLHLERGEVDHRADGAARVAAAVTLGETTSPTSASLSTTMPSNGARTIGLVERRLRPGRAPPRATSPGPCAPASTSATVRGEAAVGEAAAAGCAIPPRRAVSRAGLRRVGSALRSRSRGERCPLATSSAAAVQLWCAASVGLGLGLVGARFRGGLGVLWPRIARPARCRLEPARGSTPTSAACELGLGTGQRRARIRRSNRRATTSPFLTTEPSVTAQLDDAAGHVRRQRRAPGGDDVAVRRGAAHGGGRPTRPP